MQTYLHHVHRLAVQYLLICNSLRLAPISSIGKWSLNKFVILFCAGRIKAKGVPRCTRHMTLNWVFVKACRFIVQLVFESEVYHNSLLFCTVNFRDRIVHVKQNLFWSNCAKNCCSKKCSHWKNFTYVYLQFTFIKEIERISKWTVSTRVHLDKKTMAIEIEIDSCVRGYYVYVLIIRFKVNNCLSKKKFACSPGYELFFTMNIKRITVLEV